MPEEAGQRRIVLAKQRIERSLAVTGCAFSRGVIRAVQGDLPAAAEQRERKQGAGDTAADNRRIALLATGSCKPGRAGGDIQRPGHFTDQHFAFAAEPFTFLHGKACFLQAATDKTGGGKGGQRAARSGQAGHCPEQLRCPHIRIFRRCETIKKPGVDLLIQRIIELVGQRVDIPEPQIQRDASVIQQQTMAASDRQRPLRL